MDRRAPQAVDDGWSITSARSRRQLGLFFAGSTFVVLSSLITRRAVVRRHQLTRPAFFHPSNMPPITSINGALEALDALGIATINVFSYGIMLGGGLLWAFNISTLAEFKDRMKMPLDLKSGEETGDKSEDGAGTWLAAAIVLKEEEERQNRARKEEISKEASR
jgi:hypothetical protein